MKDDKTLGAQGATEVVSAGSIASTSATARRDNGGPAFPVLEEYSTFNEHAGRYEDHYAPHGGMTLRDYFAAQAMPQVMHVPAIGVENAAAKIASVSYAMADAMLKERSKP